MKELDEMTREAFAVIWETIHLKATDSYDVPPEMLWINGSTIGTFGNFSASTGKAKSKKTFNISAIVAAALTNDEVLHYAADLPDNKRKILYIDTEQSKYHCQKVMKRILRLAGCSPDEERDSLIFVALREFNPHARIQIINYLIENIQELGLVVIDGVRDLMYDINNPSEATELINILMKWTSKYNLHVHTVLHLNKSDDNIRGHIGTELGNKAETILQITQSEIDKNISEVKAMHIRDREFEPFAFCINDESLPELVEGYQFKKGAGQQSATLKDLSATEHHKALKAAFNEEVIKGYANLITALQKGYETIGFSRKRNTLIKLNTFLKEKGFISGDKTGYRYNPDATL